MCEREHTRTHVWRCAALMLGDRPKSSRGCLLKTAERGEQLSMAVGHSLTLQSAVDSPPPQDDNSKASLILCVWHTSLILGQIRFQPLSSSPFRFPLFWFFWVFFVLHTCYPFTRAFGIWWLQDRRCWQWEKCALTVQNDRHQEREKAHWHFVCSSVFFTTTKKQTRKKNLISLSYLLNFLSFFLFFFFTCSPD